MTPASATLPDPPMLRRVLRDRPGHGSVNHPDDVRLVRTVPDRLGGYRHRGEAMATSTMGRWRRSRAMGREVGLRLCVRPEDPSGRRLSVAAGPKGDGGFRHGPRHVVRPFRACPMPARLCPKVAARTAQPGGPRP